MDAHLTHDLESLDALLERAARITSNYWRGIDAQPPAKEIIPPPALGLPSSGIGADAALTLFKQRYASGMAGSSGPRYWGFVTGGTTPAALIGDWLTTAYDTNLADRHNSAAPQIELDTIRLLRDFFSLPASFHGVFVTGATTANIVGLALGREWVGRQRGIEIGNEGLYGTPPVRVLSAEPHSTIFKAMSILGMGRSHLTRVAMLDGREAMDVADLERQLAALNGEPVIVSASAGTVNTVDFDDFAAIAALKERFPFWLHVDAAFGGFAACSPRYASQLNGWENADSITVDAHKWMNVPYDAAMIFTPHIRLQSDVFQNRAAYLPAVSNEPDFLHLTPESSRRLRALPAWFTLTAYGRDGYREIVERTCEMAQELGQRVAESIHFELLRPVRMNVVCFSLREDRTPERVAQFLTHLRDDGRVYLTPGNFDGEPGFRAALVNWRTTEADIDIAWRAFNDVVEAMQS
jgi:glutamate/tyrosine decarboxylase-like PLP-dependent enzyme